MILGQARPGDTSNFVVYSAASKKAKITEIFIANTTGSAATCRLFAAKNEVADETTALYFDKQIAANDTLVLTGLQILLEEPGDQIVFRSGTSSALTISLFGEELEE